MGMGRVPGNLPIELIADYLNDYGEGVYDIDYIMDAIQDYIAPLKGEAEWGYTPAYRGCSPIQGSRPLRFRDYYSSDKAEGSCRWADRP